MMGPAFEAIAEKAVEMVKDVASKFELPDDSGEKDYSSKLPDDSGKIFSMRTQLTEAKESDYPSTYGERLTQTPNETGERGVWTGNRGESKFMPNDKEMQDTLKKFGLDGIMYKDAIPDFSKCSACTVEIPHMTENRQGAGNNFDQCDHKCAGQWNQECRDGRNDWVASDVREWRSANGYSWHERNDMKTCDLIPTKVNDYFGHLGGVGECRRRDAVTDFGGEFDE